MYFWVRCLFLTRFPPPGSTCPIDLYLHLRQPTEKNIQLWITPSSSIFKKYRTSHASYFYHLLPDGHSQNNLGPKLRFVITTRFTCAADVSAWCCASDKSETSPSHTSLASLSCWRIFSRPGAAVSGYNFSPCSMAVLSLWRPWSFSAIRSYG